MLGEWIDVSTPLDSGIVHWPGDPDVEIRQDLLNVEGTVVHLTSMKMGAHTGTHMDAPLHFVDGADSMDSWEMDDTNGLAEVILIEDPGAIRAAELRRHQIEPGSRVLFRTENSAVDWRSKPFNEDFVYVARDAAELLAARRVRAIGVDYLSVGGYKNDLVATHVALLSAKIWIIEGLDLSRITPGKYDMRCMPLRLRGADGSPARVLLRKA